MNIEMNNKLPEFNAEIGKEFDYQSVYLKKRHSRLTIMFVVFLFLGAGFIDLGLREQIPLTLGLLFTFLSLLFYWYKNHINSNEQWTYTRVVAESIKSEWFKYISGGGDYPCNKKIGEEYYKELFISNIEDKVAEYRDNIIRATGKPIEFKINVDPTTKEYRGYSFDDRIEIYKKNRIEDQLKWYEQKTLFMEKREKIYRTFFYTIVLIGMIFGGLKYFGIGIGNINLINNSDWFSIAVALAFALENISGFFQYERLAINYKKSASDLRESLKKITSLENDVRSDENVFSEFVEDVENRISNEHKSWSLTTSSKNIAKI